MHENLFCNYLSGFVAYVKWREEPVFGIPYHIYLEFFLAEQALDYRLIRNRNSQAGCNRAYSLPAPGGDILNRDLILNLFSDETLSIQSLSGVFSTPELDTGFGIFDLTDTMTTPIVAFSVARDSHLIGETDPVPFNINLANAGNHYDDRSHRFYAPSAGIYFFSISAGIFSGITVNLQMHVENQLFIDLNRQSTHHADVDIISRSIMLQLGLNDTVHMVNGPSEAFYSSPLLETSFSGFKYDPILDSAMVGQNV